MTHYPFCRHVLLYLDTPFVPFKHWSMSSSWAIAECLQQVVLDRIKREIANNPFVFLTCNDVTIILTIKLGSQFTSM